MVSYITYDNTGGIRSQEMSPRLVEALSFLQDMGIRADVFSGGQMSLQDAINAGAVKRGRQWYLDGHAVRTGSTRHDHGMAGDMDFYRGDHRLDWNNPNDLYYFDQIVRRGLAAGLTGFGAGKGSEYMGAGRMHVGYGTNAYWGAGGNTANAPEWLARAYRGDPFIGTTPAQVNAGLAPEPVQPVQPVSDSTPTPTATQTQPPPTATPTQPTSTATPEVPVPVAPDSPVTVAPPVPETPGTYRPQEVAPTVREVVPPMTTAPDTPPPMPNDTPPTDNNMDTLVNNGTDALLGVGKSALLSLIMGGSGGSNMSLPAPPAPPQPRQIQEVPFSFNIGKKKKRKA